MLPAIHSGLSGARAFARKMDVAAGNVANASTREYKRVRAVLQEGSAGGVSAQVERVTTPGPQVLDTGGQTPEFVELSNVELAEEVVGMIEGQRGFELNLKTIQTADEMLGAMLDLKG